MYPSSPLTTAWQIYSSYYSSERSSSLRRMITNNLERGFHDFLCVNHIWQSNDQEVLSFCMLAFKTSARHAGYVRNGTSPLSDKSSVLIKKNNFLSYLPPPPPQTFNLVSPTLRAHWFRQKMPQLQCQYWSGINEHVSHRNNVAHRCVSIVSGEQWSSFITVLNITLLDLQKTWIHQRLHV